MKTDAFLKSIVSDFDLQANLLVITTQLKIEKKIKVGSISSTVQTELKKEKGITISNGNIEQSSNQTSVHETVYDKTQ